MTINDDKGECIRLSTLSMLHLRSKSTSKCRGFERRSLDERREIEPSFLLATFSGTNPQVGKGTLVYLPITQNKDFTKDPSKWDARVRNTEGARITMEVRIPANAAVGVWRVRISTKPQGSRNIKTFEVSNKIYLLFNAWNKGKCYFLLLLKESSRFSVFPFLCNQTTASTCPMSRRDKSTFSTMLARFTLAPTPSPRGDNGSMDR